MRLGWAVLTGVNEVRELRVSVQSIHCLFLSCLVLSFRCESLEGEGSRCHFKASLLLNLILLGLTIDGFLSVVVQFLTNCFDDES